MGLFGNKKFKELDDIIERLDMNLGNNYKDLAIDARNELEKAIDRMSLSGELSGKNYEKYYQKLTSYTIKMKDYHH